MRLFRNFTILSTILTYILIFVGGMVRVAGAGMGCPDWPKCFDRWIPPTSIEQLPDHIDPAKFNIVLAWIEYGNRLFGALVGLSIAITLYLGLKHCSHLPRIKWPVRICFSQNCFKSIHYYTSSFFCVNNCYVARFCRSRNLLYFKY